MKNSKEYMRNYYKSNKKKMKIYRKRYTEKNKEEIRIKSKEWRDKNIEKIREWREKNRHKIKNYRKPKNLNWRDNRICIHCKNEYIPKAPNQKLCSRECAQIFNSFEYMAKNGTSSQFHKLRFEVFKRDNFTCTYCGRNVKDDHIKLRCDHITPKKLNGEWSIDNLTTSCFECNAGKGCVILSEIIK